MKSWMISAPEPANGRYVKVGENPDEVVAVRADALDATRGEWYRLKGEGRAAMVSFEQLTTAASDDPLKEPRQLTVVPLYEAGQAIEDLVLGLGQATYQRYRLAAMTGTGSLAAQYNQAALAIRAFCNDLAARHGVEVPPWDGTPPADVVAPVDPLTQTVAPVSGVATARGVAVVRQEAGKALAADGAPRWSWRNFVPALFAGPQVNGGQPREAGGDQSRRGGRHRRADWVAADVKVGPGEGGAAPKVGAPG